MPNCTAGFARSEIRFTGTLNGLKLTPSATKLMKTKNNLKNYGMYTGALAIFVLHKRYGQQCNSANYFFTLMTVPSWSLIKIPQLQLKCLALNWNRVDNGSLTINCHYTQAKQFQLFLVCYNPKISKLSANTNHSKSLNFLRCNKEIKQGHSDIMNKETK